MRMINVADSGYKEVVFEIVHNVSAIGYISLIHLKKFKECVFNCRNHACTSVCP